jgi:hypothetical protein
MRVNRQWEVKCPPVKKHVVAGMFVPTVKGVFSGRLVQKKRRITIEIHGPDVPLRTKKEAPTPRRGLTRSANDAGSMQVVDLSSELKDDDRIRVRILKPRKQWGFMRDHEDSSTSEDGDDEKEHEHDLNASHDSGSATSHDDGWIEYRKYDLDEIEDEELHKKSWEATLGRFHHMERREIMFPNDEEGKQQSSMPPKCRWMIRGPCISLNVGAQILAHPFLCMHSSIYFHSFFYITYIQYSQPKILLVNCPNSVPWSRNVPRNDWRPIKRRGKKARPSWPRLAKPLPNPI